LFAELFRELKNLAVAGVLAGAQALVSKAEGEYRWVEGELRIFLD
jgi:hypothetical protein